MTPGDYSKKSKAGAEGLMQIMPATAQRWNINVDDPRDSIRGAVDVVAELQTRLGTTDPLFLAASYNAGDKAVRGYAQATSDLPSETKKYVAAVDLAYLALSDPNRGKNP
jgi:soluble lytic murein transglycosylase-like protein